MIFFNSCQWTVWFFVSLIVEDEAESLCTTSEAINSNPATKDKTDKPKATKDSQEMSEVVKVLRQRREDMANKIERKQQEENER